MREYIRRHYTTDTQRAQRLAQRTAAWLRRRYAASVRQALPEISARLNSHGAELQVTVRGHLGRLFPTRTRRRLERLLACSATSLTLRIEELRAQQHEQIAQLLQRLRPYGQRVSIWTSEHLRSTLAIDSSTFHLILDEPHGHPIQTTPPR
jgi:hypothetical protein